MALQRGLLISLCLTALAACGPNTPNRPPPTDTGPGADGASLDAGDAAVEDADPARDTGSVEDAVTAVDATPVVDAGPVDAGPAEDAPPPTDGGGFSCRTDSECPMGLRCARAQQRCVECVLQADCGNDRICAQNRCVAPTACQSSRMCPGQVCNTAAGRCNDCVGNNDCPMGELCRDNVCVSARACRSSRECNDRGQVCDTARSVCVDCVGDEDCETGTFCAAGNVCRPQVCVPNVRRCLDLTRIQACDSRGSTQTEQTCASNQSCSEGNCRNRVCTPGALSCANLQTRATCNADGLGTSTEACPSGQICNNGACLSQVCVPGTASCSDASTARICNGDGLGYSLRGCIVGQSCRDGMCLSRICTPGAADCTTDGQRRVCNSDGLGYTTTACEAMRSCQAGVCRSWVCTPNQGSCLDPRTVRACASDGLSETTRSCGTNASCVNGACTGWICVPGEATCTSATERRVCNSDGLGFSTGTCASRQTCTRGACQAWVCTPGERTCVDNGNVRVCNSDGLGFSTQACATRQSCAMGQCTPWVCTPGDTSCVDASSVRICNPDGLTYTASACQRPTNATSVQCSSNRCSFTCASGYVPSGSACIPLDPPRPIAPASGASVRRRPTFRWSLPTGALGARLQLCPDRACNTVTLTQEIIGTSFQPMTDLPTGRFYWRLFSLADMNGVSPTASSPWLISISDRGGTSITADLNLDGNADMVIGGSGANRVAIFRGADTTVDFGLSAPTSGYYFGTSSAFLGDVNGDGYPDLAIGAYYGNRVYVYFGTANGIGTTPTVISGSATYFGYALAGLGDVNGDGFADMAVGAASTSTSSSRVFVYYGSASGFPSLPSLSLNRSAESYFGYIVAAAGDLNGDGFADMLTTGYNNSTAHVWYGSSTGLSSTPVVITQSTTGCGYSASGLGDVNGDGYADIAVGCSSSSTSSTRVFVYGGRAGNAAPATLSSLVDNTTSAFGRLVRGAGDINGDGFNDMLVSDGGTSSLVWLYISNGAGFTSSGRATVPRPSGASLTYFGRSLAGVGDIDGDGFGDLIVGDYSASRAHVFRGQGGGTSPIVTTPISLADSGTTYFGYNITSIY